MIATDSTKKLYEKLDIAKRQLKNAKSREEILAISKYICQIYGGIEDITKKKRKYSCKELYGSGKNKEVINSKLYEYNDKMRKNYLANKSFHNAFFESTYKRVSHEYSKVEEGCYAKETELSEDDFYNIFFEFMNSIGFSKCFDKFVKDDRIYNTQYNKETPTFAYSIYNPLTKDSDIFIEDVEYTLTRMFFIAHEFGHIYDLNNFNDGVESYNQYFYQSFNGETIPKLFERLFVDFLIEKEILLLEAKDLLFILATINFDYIAEAYITSLLPNISIYDGSYLQLKPKEVYNLVEKYFSRKDNIKKVIDTVNTFEIQETNSYAYGDIYSMYLKELVKENNGNLDCLKEFFKYRKDMFNTDIIKKYNISPQGYVKLYKKDIELLKKPSN